MSPSQSIPVYHNILNLHHNIGS